MREAQRWPFVTWRVVLPRDLVHRVNAAGMDRDQLNELVAQALTEWLWKRDAA